MQARDVVRWALAGALVMLVTGCGGQSSSDLGSAPPTSAPPPSSASGGSSPSAGLSAGPGAPPQALVPALAQAMADHHVRRRGPAPSLRTLRIRLGVASLAGRTIHFTGWPPAGVAAQQLVVPLFDLAGGGSLAALQIPVVDGLPRRARPCEVPWSIALRASRPCRVTRLGHRRTLVVSDYGNLREVYVYDDRTIIDVNVANTRAADRGITKAPIPVSAREQQAMARELFDAVTG
ncbi:MAG: hypothetical protein ACR2K3_05805 [Nocardioides sp.]